MARIILVVVVTLAVLALTAWFIWLRNPYVDQLHFDAETIFVRGGASNSLVIRNATLIDVVNGIEIPNSSVVILGDTIAAVGPTDSLDSSAVPPDAQVVDASGRWLLPGFVDVHTHLQMHPDLLSGDFDPSDSLTTRVALEQFVKYGVTSVLAFGGGGGNDEQAAELKRLEESKAIVSPILYATGDILTAPGSHPLSTIMRISEDADPARLHRAGVVVVGEDDSVSPIIDRKKRLGLDGVKIIVESGPPPWYPKPRLPAEKINEIVDVAESVGLPVYAHATSYDEVMDAVVAGVNAVVHSIEDSLLAGTHLARVLIEQNVYYVPTLSVLNGFMAIENPERLDDEYLIGGIPPGVWRSHENPLLRFFLGQSLEGFDLEEALGRSMVNLQFLHQQGVQVALGSDTGTPFVFPGYAVHVEMELMTEAGLSNADVLRIATINGARLLEAADRFGNIAPGLVANLVLLRKNPLSQIRNTRTIETVILKGHVITDLPSNEI